VLAPLDGLTGAGGDGGNEAAHGSGDDGSPSIGADADTDGSPLDSSASNDATPADDAGTQLLDTGSPADSSMSGDAHGADAPEEPAPVGYCAGLTPTPLFCDDFDEGALAAPWDQVIGTSGHATLDTTFAVSPPDAMLTTVNAGATAASVDVAGYKSFSAKQAVAGTYALAFDIRVDKADTSSGSDAVLAAIALWNGSAVWSLELEVSYASATGDLTASLTENSASDYAQHAASEHLSMGGWMRVSIAITLPAGSGGTAPATMTFNGIQVAAATVHVTTSNPVPEIVVGPTFATPGSSGWVVRYDNVTFD
jgi:hypothetical protein